MSDYVVPRFEHTRCYNCNLYGHLSAVCNKPQRSQHANLQANVATAAKDESA